MPSVVVVVLLHLDAVAAAVLDVAVVNVRPVLEAADGEAVHVLGGQRVGLEEGGAPLALRGVAAELCATSACAGAAADTAARDDARTIKPEPFIFSM